MDLIMEIINSVSNMLAGIKFLLAFAMIIIAPICALQHYICTGDLKWPKWLLPTISIFLVLLSAVILCVPELKKQAMDTVYHFGSMYSGPIVIEGLLPFSGVNMLIGVAAGYGLYSMKGKKRD